MQESIKKETQAKVFSCEFYEVSKNTFFTEHFWTTASVNSGITPRARSTLLGNPDFMSKIEAYM